jgi:hypothetical protein
MVRRLKSDLRNELGVGADGPAEFPLRNILELDVLDVEDDV